MENTEIQTLLADNKKTCAELESLLEKYQKLDELWHKVNAICAKYEK